VQLPGEREQRRRDKALREGIVLPGDLLTKIQALASGQAAP
jgi:LDH2 family malate/lactate/ureidoglycolate dehydrogenase